jgi:TetR/AcrR family transcriptional regulator
VDRIARAAGLNKQLIYYYYGSKRGLYAASTDAPVTPDDPGPVAPATAADAIRKVVDGILRELAEQPEVIALLVDRSGTFDGGDAARQRLARLERAAAAVLSRGQGLGHFRDDLDPRATARAAVVLCVGYLALAPHLDAGIEDWSRVARDILVRATSW